MSGRAPGKKHKTHKNKIELDWSALDALLQFKVNQDFVADYFKVSHDTLQRRIKEKTGKTFTEYHKLKMDKTAVALQKKAIDMGLNGHPTMLIFALKNMAGWNDGQKEDVSDTNKTITLNYNIPKKEIDDGKTIEAECEEINNEHD